KRSSREGRSTTPPASPSRPPGRGWFAPPADLPRRRTMPPYVKSRPRRLISDHGRRHKGGSGHRVTVCAGAAAAEPRGEPAAARGAGGAGGAAVYAVDVRLPVAPFI